MECVIKGKPFTFNKEIRSNSKHRLSFDALSRKTFGLSFENWYSAGFWTDCYQPYTLLDGDKVVSNVSVNNMRTVWQGVQRQYVQLGTVMTDSEYRNMGLSTFLLKRVFDDWLDSCDAIYLYANDSVLDFYPRFGFVKAEEYYASLDAAPRTAAVRKLNMSNKSDIELLYNCYQKSNPFSELSIVDNWGLLMFYCSAFMKDCVYYIEDCNAIVIAEEYQKILTVFDIYCDGSASPADIVSAISGDAQRKVRLGFAWKNVPESRRVLLQEENTTLFLLSEKENIFQTHKTMFPLLSHA